MKARITAPPAANRSGVPAVSPASSAAPATMLRPMAPASVSTASAARSAVSTCSVVGRWVGADGARAEAVVIAAQCTRWSWANDDGLPGGAGERLGIGAEQQLDRPGAQRVPLKLDPAPEALDRQEQLAAVR